MQSRKDQVQAYFFVVGRLFSALTHGKPDIVETPMRRISTGAVLGMILAALLTGIFGIIGIYAPSTGASSWQQAGAIIVDSDTGARYLYLDGRLRPVLNYTSAKLATSGGSNSSGGTVVQVSGKSLAGVPVGNPIGIPGAPDAVPQAGNLDKGPWTVCVGPSGTPPPVTLLLGGPFGTPLSASQGLLVSASDGTNYLVYQGTRYRIGGPTARGGLGYGGVSPLSVPADWLNAIPAGRDLVVPRIEGIGSAGPMIDGRPSTVGQILHIQNPALNTDQVFVVLSGGVAQLNATTEALLLASPATKPAYHGGSVEPITVSPGGLVGVPTVSDSDLTGYPSSPPALANGLLSDSIVPCAQFSPSGTNATLLTMPAQDITAQASPADGAIPGATVDKVAIPGGGGVLAFDVATAGASRGTEYLITDIGVKFPLADSSVAGTLGYSASSAVDVSGRLLALLPTGPVLSAKAALTQQPPTQP